MRGLNLSFPFNFINLKCLLISKYFVTSRSTISSLEMRLAASADQLKTTNEALEANTSEPKLKEQEQQISELNDRVVTLEKEKEGLKKLLDEAAVDLKNEEEENGELSKAVAALKVNTFIVIFSYGNVTTLKKILFNFVCNFEGLPMFIKRFIFFVTEFRK